jgi:release factor glutamine methyltransferase
MTEDKCARLIIAKIKNLRYEDVLLSPKKIFLDDREQALFRGMLARYRKNEPISKIIGRRSFWKHDFFVNENVLDPRPETELIIEMVLTRFAKSAPLRFLDIGTGSGCILLSLLSEFRNAVGLGVDISQGAIQVAERNRNTLEIADRAVFLPIDWNKLNTAILMENVQFGGAVDVIVSNPPYIKSSDIALLDDNVKNYDPIIAIDGGEDGLTAYREISAITKEILVAHGTIFLEVGYNQADDVKKILINNGFSDVHSEKDLNGIDRVVVGKLIA